MFENKRKSILYVQYEKSFMMITLFARVKEGLTDAVKELELGDGGRN